MKKEYANGLDRTNVTRQDFEYPIKSVGNEIKFLDDLIESDEVFPMIHVLSGKVAECLCKDKKKARGPRSLQATRPTSQTPP